MLFSNYEAMVGPGQASDIKDCQLDIKLTSPAGLSYSVASFHYQGYALLDTDGMRARQTARYYFDGVRERAADQNELRGPFDDSYLFSDDISPGHRAGHPAPATTRSTSTRGSRSTMTGS